MCDVNKTNANSIAKQLNYIHKNMQFEDTVEDNGLINCLDIAIKRDDNNLKIGIYRKPTYADSTIHFTSNHSMQKKLAAYRYIQHRIYTLPITGLDGQQEIKTILTIATNNGFRLK